MYHDERDSEFIKVLEAHSDGLTYDQLLNKCSSFETNVDLSRCIHHHTQLGLCYKRNGLYFATSVAPATETSNVTAEIKAIIEKTPELRKLQITEEQADKKIPKVVVKRKESPSPVETKEVSKTTPSTERIPHGDLRATKVGGAIAYAFYRFRDEDALSYGDLQKITGLSKGQIYSAVYKLLDDGYIKQLSNKPTFVWSGVYCYPFSTVRPTDKFLIKMTPVDFVRDTGDVSVIEQSMASDNVITLHSSDPALQGVGITVKSPFAPDIVQKQTQQVLNNKVAAIELIEHRLDYLQQEIKSLERIKTALLNSIMDNEPQVNQAS